MKNPFRKKEPTPREAFLRTYLDCIAPGVVKFEVDHYIFGSTYRCVWALREYPASTEAQAILRHLGEKSGVTLRIYCRQVSPGEEDRIIDNANKKNKLDGSDPNKLRQTVEAESNLRDVAELVHKMHREHEPLLHCAVYLEMTADSMEGLKRLQTDVLTELVRCKLNVDKLLLRQKQGFCCVSPVGHNALGREFERVLPAGSVANLYPFNYSGKTDPKGIYIGKDKYGSNTRTLCTTTVCSLGWTSTARPSTRTSAAQAAAGKCSASMWRGARQNTASTRMVQIAPFTSLKRPSTCCLTSRSIRRDGWSIAMWPAAAHPSSRCWSVCGRIRS